MGELFDWRKNESAVRLAVDQLAMPDEGNAARRRKPLLWLFSANGLLRNWRRASEEDDSAAALGLVHDAPHFGDEQQHPR
jgi:hypothetical protein